MGFSDNIFLSRKSGSRYELKVHNGTNSTSGSNRSPYTSSLHFVKLFSFVAVFPYHHCQAKAVRVYARAIRSIDVTRVKICEMKNEARS